IAFLQTEKWISSETIFKHSLAVTSNNIQIHLNLGMVLLAHNRPDEATQHYQEVVRLNPTFAEGHYNLAVALAKQHKIIEAVKHYEEALRLKPDFDKARFNLERLKESLSMAK
ncbi:MAG: tetratricopeptide repeat protein, partial [Acidobacteriota bacterium]